MHQLEETQLHLWQGRREAFNQNKVSFARQSVHNLRGFLDSSRSADSQVANPIEQQSFRIQSEFDSKPSPSALRELKENDQIVPFTEDVLSFCSALLKCSEAVNLEIRQSLDLLNQGFLNELWFTEGKDSELEIRSVSDEKEFEAKVISADQEKFPVARDMWNKLMLGVSSEKSRMDFEYECYRYMIDTGKGLYGVLLLREFGFSLEPMRKRVLSTAIRRKKTVLDSTFDFKSVFSIALRRYRHGDRQAHDILKFLAFQCTTQWMYMQISSFAQDDQDWPLEDFEDVCQFLIAGSPNILITTLLVSDLCKKLSKKYISLREQFVHLQDRFTKSAISTIDGIPNDFLACLYLEKKDTFGRSALDVAVKTRNASFMGSIRVTNVLDRIWKTSNFMMRDDEIPIFQLLVWHPDQFYRLPYTRFMLRSLSFLILVLVIFIVAMTRLYQNQSLKLLEFGMFLSALSIIHEVFTLIEMGFTLYFSSWNNKVAIPIYVLSLCLFVILFGEGDKLDTPWLCMLPLLILVRVLQMLRINTRFGALLVIFVDVMEQTYQFVVFLLLIWLSFVFCFALFLSEYEVEGFTSFFETSITTFGGMLGAYDISPLGQLPDQISQWIQILFSAYAFITMVIIVNMLVAFMSNALTTGYAKSMQAYYLGLVEIILEHDIYHRTLQSPFSILTWVIYYSKKIARMCCCFVECGRQMNRDLRLWKCPRCSAWNNIDGEEARVVLLSRVLDFEHKEGRRSNLPLYHFVENLLYPTAESCASLCKGCLRPHGERRTLYKSAYDDWDDVSLTVFLFSLYPLMLILAAIWKVIVYIWTLPDHFQNSTVEAVKFERNKILQDLSAHVRNPRIQRKVAEWAFSKLTLKTKFTVNC